MTTLALVDPGSGVINLDQPGTYLHWSVFTVSVANLVLIAVMVADDADVNRELRLFHEGGQA